MTDNQLQIVNFEQAKRLKEAGFNWYTDDFYIKGKVYHRPEYINKIGRRLSHGSPKFTDWNNWEATEGIRFSAPTTALALKWMRDAKNLPNMTFLSAVDKKYRSEYSKEPRHKIFDLFDTHEAAESALLDELLNVLETNKNSN